MNNIKKKSQCLWPIYLFASIQSTSSGAQQGAEAVFCSFIEQLTNSTAKFPNGCTSFNQFTLIFIFIFLVSLLSIITTNFLYKLQRLHYAIAYLSSLSDQMDLYGADYSPAQYRTCRVS
jgi:hypothetical protein